MNVTFDDSSSESESSQESEGEVKQNFVAFTASLLSPQEQGEDEEDISNHSSSGDDMSEEDFQEELLFSRILENSKSLTKKNKELLMKVTSLEVEKKDLILQMNEYPKKAIEDSEILKGKEKEIKILKNDLGMAHERITSLLNEMKMVKEELCKSEEMLMKFNHGSNNLMSMMSGAKYSGDRKGLGFDNCKGASTSTSTTFVKAKVFPSSQTGSGILAKEQVSMPVDQQQSSKHFTKSQAETRNTRRSSQTIHTCSYCGYRGHLQNTCKFYLDDLHHTHRERKRLKMFKQLQQKARALTGEIGRLTNPSFRKNIYSGKIYVEKESQQRYTSKPTDTTPKKKEKWVWSEDEELSPNRLGGVKTTKVRGDPVPTPNVSQGDTHCDVTSEKSGEVDTESQQDVSELQRPKWARNHTVENIIGDGTTGIMTRRQVENISRGSLGIIFVLCSSLVFVGIFLGDCMSEFRSTYAASIDS
ncbi:hypothetical protein BVC80_8849g8 [Macleaya cordata]|uniref:Uncharacterized protein n=1 Tax=Macleaya cordata TaxID=56857 RepID=A0A200RDW5_MACCD|nr:hypothetical protein BVC80_8849g8 [Macleaya cordata]